MSTGVFIGTFDPLHGAHIGQLLRAYKFQSFSKIHILVNKHPQHKPHTSTWQHRIAMINLTLASFNLPFEYTVQAATSPHSVEIDDLIDFKIIRLDSLIEDLKE